MVEKLRDRILDLGPGGSERPLTREEMLAWAAAVDLDAVDLDGYCSFSDESYTRNPVLKNEHLELVVICWRAGQKSPIHDHGVSNCLYVVTGGTMAEEIYESTGQLGVVKLVESRDWGRGESTIADGPTIHRVCNLSDHDLVTIHLYSPPLPVPPNTFKEAGA
jgi:cysteine dioxygenase